MADLYTLLDECRKILDRLHIPYCTPKAVRYNGRLSRSLGRCIQRGFSFEIEISTHCKDANADFLMSLMLHELLHTCIGCMNHGRTWKAYAALVTRNTPYTITVTSDDSACAANNVDLVELKPRYMLKCPECGTTWYYRRRCKPVDHPENYQCFGCKKDLQLFAMADFSK